MNVIDTTNRAYALRNDETQEQRRAALLAELSAEKHALAECDAALEELAQSADHEASDERVMWLRVRTRALESIEDIGEALVRLDQGISESCVRCGERIGQARLDALPRTKRCIRCASVTDRSRLGRQT